MRGFILAGLLFILVAYTALLVANNLDCIPVERHWNPTVDGHCLPAGSLAYSSGAFNVASDIFVVFLPLPAIWKLNMRLSRRLKIMTVFGFGIMYVCLAFLLDLRSKS